MLNNETLFEYSNFRRTKNKNIFCHAPFTSMNFEQNGNVTVCCYNRTDIYGSYPDNAVEDIWYGSMADRIRRYMKKNVLPAGCYICYAEFINKNFEGLKALLYDHLSEPIYLKKDGRFMPMPRIMEFEISNACNLECIMCNGYFSSAIRKNRDKIPASKNPYDDQFVEQLEYFIPHLKEARFLGGEPFLIRIYYRIWDLIIQKNPDAKVNITTNGTILNNRIKDILEKMNANIIVSIDSLDKENYENIRVNAKFDQVMENLEYFVEYTKRKNNDLSFAVCPMQQNWKEIPLLLEFCNEQDIYLYFNTVLRPENVTLKTVKKDKLFEIIEYFKAIDLTEYTFVSKANNSKYRALIQQIESYYSSSFEDEYINGDLRNEYEILLRLFERHHKLLENDEINKLINSTVIEILKRFANRNSVVQIVYDDKETLEIGDHFFDNPNIFHPNEKINQHLKLIYNKTKSHRFIEDYKTIMKLVLSVLKDKGHEAVTDLHKKFDDVFQVFESLPAKKLFINALINADVLFVLRLFQNLTSEQLIKIMHSRFG